MNLPRLKKLPNLLLGSTLLGFLPGLAAQDWPQLPKVDTPPVIDGVQDDIWYAGIAHSFESVERGEVDDVADLSALWYALWDDDYLYLLVDATDNFLTSDSAPAVYLNDVMELYLDMDNGKDGANSYTGDNFQYTFGWNLPDGKFGAKANWTGVEWAQVNTATGYRNEIKIPWTSLTTASVGVDFEFGFDIALNDNDGNATYDGVMYWHNQSGGLYGNMNGAGVVKLVAQFDGNYPPRFESFDVISVNADSPADFVFQAVDQNTSDTLSFTFADLPAFAAATDNGDGTVKVSFSPAAADVGTYTFMVTVSDGSKAISADAYLIVRDPQVASQVPVILDPGTVTATEGDRTNVAISVEDLDDFVVTLSAGVDPWPDFVTLTEVEAKSAVLSFNPAFGDAGSYTIALVATDGDNNEATFNLNFTVSQGVALTEFYCDPVNGSMDNNGSSEAPWSTLEAVFAAGKSFKPGDTIYLRSGFHGSITIESANTGVVYIKPEAGAKPTFKKVNFALSSAMWEFSGGLISGEADGIFQSLTYLEISGADIVVRDSQIESVADPSGWTAGQWIAAGNGVRINGDRVLLEDVSIRNVRFGVSIDGSNIRVSRCSVINFSGDGMRPTADGAIIEDCYIANCYNVDDNHDDGIQSWSNGPSGPGSGTIKDVIIRRNTIIENTNPNNPFPGPLQGIGMFDGFYENFVIENNVVLVTAPHGIGIYGAIDCKLVNNTVLDASGTQRSTWIAVHNHKTRGNATGNLILNNLTTVLSGVDSSKGEYANNLSIPPADFDKYFVNFPTNVSLKATAPAVNVGRNTGATTDDITGEMRLRGTNAIVDVGAYELNSWRGWPLIGTWSSTEGFLGWLEVSADPWSFSYSLNSWLYLPAAVEESASGGWVWFMKR